MENLSLNYLEGKKLTEEMEVNTFIDYINKHSEVPFEYEPDSDSETLQQINQIVKIIDNRNITEAILNILSKNETYLISTALVKPIYYEKMNYLLNYCLFGSIEYEETEEKTKMIDSLIFLISYLKNHPEKDYYRSFHQYERKSKSGETDDITSNMTKEIQNQILNEQKGLKNTSKTIENYEKIKSQNQLTFKFIDLKMRLKFDDNSKKLYPIKITNEQMLSYMYTEIKRYINSNMDSKLAETASSSTESIKNDVFGYIKSINDNLLKKYNPIKDQQFTYIFWQLTGLINEELELKELSIPKKINSKIFFDKFSNYKSTTKKIMRS